MPSLDEDKSMSEQCASAYMCIEDPKAVGKLKEGKLPQFPFSIVAEFLRKTILTIFRGSKEKKNLFFFF